MGGKKKRGIAMSPKRGRNRYAHQYHGKHNSRGKRALSKMHKGVRAIDLEKLEKELGKTA